LNKLDQEFIEKAYILFKKVYSANKIANIKITKEEQYQEGFIKDNYWSSNEYGGGKLL